MIRTAINIGGSRLSDNDFTSVDLSQSLGSHHRFTIRLRQDANKGILMDKAKSWIGKTAVISIGEKEDSDIGNSPPPDVFSGVVTSLSLSRERGTSMLIVSGESATVYLDDGPNARSFTEMRLQEIVDKVMKPYNGSFPNTPEINPEIFKDTLPFCVQYKESNFSFLNRLANRYGEWFYYDGLNLFFGKSANGKAIKLDFGKNGLNSFDIALTAIPAKFEIQGYDYLTHKSHSEESPLNTKSNDLGNEVFKISKNDLFTEKALSPIAANIEKSNVQKLAKRKEQILLDEMVIVNGQTINPSLKLGAKIEISDTQIKETYGTYVITSLMHYIGQGGDYNNSFTAIPVEVTTPPINALPNPPFCETQLAKVTNVDDEDGLGRVKVKFLWQENSSEESPWIRVASPYTGKDKGFYIIPEVDDQVLVAFENSNADLPYVLTGMYNGEAKPEWFDGKNYFKGFKTKEKNQIKFDDKNKSILIDAPESITMSAGKTITIKTGGEADSEINIEVGQGTVNVVAKVVKVDAAQTVEINSKKEIIANATNTIELKSSNELTASGTKKVEVKGAQVLVEGKAKSEVKGAMVDVSGSALVNVKGALVKIN